MIEDERTPELLINTFLKENLNIFNSRDIKRYPHKSYKPKSAMKRMQEGFSVKKHRYAKTSIRTFKLRLSKNYSYIIIDMKEKVLKIKVCKIIGVLFGNESSTFLMNKQPAHI